VYTDPAYRGQGLASALLNRLVVEAKRRSVRKLFLEASTIGKPMYKKYGFIENDAWMELWVDALD
jgi:GNAT superfamily N-acetyltransferase